LYPKIKDDTAVSRDSLRKLYNSFPGPNIPLNLLPFGRLKFTKFPDLNSYPLLVPEFMESYADFVSAVDLDGNEIAGVRLPDISVPLATYTGWNQVSEAPSDIPMFLMGSTIVFPKEGRSIDPRESIQERYKSKDDYLEKIRNAANNLKFNRYLLDEDVDYIVEKSDERWNEYTNLQN
jgi:hypothetical protein